MAQRLDAVFEIVRLSQPTGIRFIYYRAVVEGIVPKTQAGYQKVQRALVQLRDSGQVPYSWIVDNTRWMRKPDSWDSVESLLDEVTACYRRSLWWDAGSVVEVWAESESIAGVIYPVTERWDVPLFPCKGQSSTFAWGAAQTYRHDPRPVAIYYVGDYDPAGLEIESNLAVKLRRFSGRDDLTLRRLACTAEQVAQLDPPGTKPKKDHYTDPVTRQRTPWIGAAVEVEALEPDYLRTLVEDAIAGHVDPDALALHRRVEAEERAGLEALAAGRWPR